MNIQDALNIIEPENNTLESLKKSYREKAITYHPDKNPDGLDIMKLVNVAYEFLTKHLGKWDINVHATDNPNILEDIIRIWKEINALPDIQGEVCGTWLWVTGNSYQYRGVLKELGLKWSRGKKAWYWHPVGYRKLNRNTYNMNEIRNMWGSEELEKEERLQVA